jgi:hypothetical protein
MILLAHQPPAALAMFAARARAVMEHQLGVETQGIFMK